MRIVKQTSATSDSEIVASWLSDKSNRSRSTYAGAVKQFLSFTGKPLAELRVEDLQLRQRFPREGEKLLDGSSVGTPRTI